MVAEDSTPKTYGFSTYGCGSSSDDVGYYDHGEIVVIENKNDGSPNWIFRIPKYGSEECNDRGNQSYLFFHKRPHLMQRRHEEYLLELAYHQYKPHFLGHAYEHYHEQ